MLSINDRASHHDPRGIISNCHGCVLMMQDTPCIGTPALSQNGPPGHLYPPGCSGANLHVHAANKNDQTLPSNPHQVGCDAAISAPICFEHQSGMLQGSSKHTIKHVSSITVPRAAAQSPRRSAAVCSLRTRSRSKTLNCPVPPPSTSAQCHRQIWQHTRGPAPLHSDDHSSADRTQVRSWMDVNPVLKWQYRQLWSWHREPAPCRGDLGSEAARGFRGAHVQGRWTGWPR